jgi:hypothetical protein
VSLTNPFPNGLVKPSGSSLGLLAGAGTSINFVDETRKSPRVQQYTVDLQRELGADMAVTFSYVGARGDHLPLGGTINTAVNINQLDPKYLALGSTVLNQQVANPFFGNPAFAGTALGNNATTTRGQLLRPFPQFFDISMFQVSEGVNRYNAGVVELSKRVTHGWGGRFSYTYSVLKDNQVGETNFYSHPGAGGPINNYNYVASLPACTGRSGRELHPDVLRSARRLHQRHPRHAAPLRRRTDRGPAVRQGSTRSARAASATCSPAAGRWRRSSRGSRGSRLV